MDESISIALKKAYADGVAVGVQRGREFATKELIAELERKICFDALADHKEMEQFRAAHPEVVGRCAHHGGKCTDLLLLISKLQKGADNG